MSLPFTIVDAFTNQPFGGSPAAVIFLPKDAPTYRDELLQTIAIELNHPATAFVTHIEPFQTEGSQSPLFGIRWFTPAREIRICGHATLATASLLFQNEALVPRGLDVARFSSLSGILSARRVAGTTKVELEFPVGDIEPTDQAIYVKVANSVARTTSGIASEDDVVFVGVCKAAPYQEYILIEIRPEIDLEALPVNPLGLDPLIVITNQVVAPRPDASETSPAGHSVLLPASFHLRMFAPLKGINEDHVTGSACSFATKYWTAKAGIAPGVAMAVRQVSARGGDVEVVWDDEKGTARLRGETRVSSHGV
ncbi:Diaminopimelate epimerase-like protein, partial [Serendipita vermifera]